MIDLQDLKNRLLEKGASFVGFADVSDIPENHGMKGAISIGIKLLDCYVEDIAEANAPTYEYFHHYRTVNAALDGIALYCAEQIERNGVRSRMIPASQSSVTDPYRGAFPHKTAAVRARLGFIGKSALFIHDEFGSKVRLATVLVDLPLTADRTPAQRSCGSCRACFQACPAGAITGNTYVEGAPRDSIFIAEKCSAHMKSAYQSIGRGSVCGICMAVCPFNKGIGGRRE